MDSVIPAVRRRSACALWLSSQCHYGLDCRCRLAWEADAEAAQAAEAVIPPARRPQ
jgi:hypothetical protein